jgi:hypothetical protein
MSGRTYTGKGDGKDRPMQIDDETLMALADGELDPARAAELHQVIAADPELQSRLHRFQETRRLLAGLRRKTVAEDPLAAMIRAAAVTGTAGPSTPALTVNPASLTRPAPRPGGQPLTAPERPPFAPANLNRRPWMALAASIGIVAIGLGWWQWGDGTGPQAFSTAELAALDGLPSGQVQALEEGGELAMIASFRASDGAFCREYETAQGENLRVVLACRSAGGWDQRFAAVSTDAGQDYRPASGKGSIDEAIAAIGATGPMTPGDEAAALRE